MTDMMRVYHNLPDLGPAIGCEVAIGNFDGVHRGHRALIDQLVALAHARGHLAGVVTFDPHPMRVLNPDASLAFLTTPAERLELLAATGLDFTVVYPFTRETAQMPAADYMQALVDRLRLRRLWVGPDFTLGRRREGDVPTLRRLGEQMGFKVTVVEPVAIGGAEVRSGAIRAALAAGEVDQAAALLGRPYGLAGEVISGAGRGRTIGLPTVNLAAPDDRVLPAYGVYATWCTVAGQRLPAATNVGVRPTFDHGIPSIESHILDFTGDLYGAPLRVEFVLRLRAEERFPGVDALIAQVRRDVANARRTLQPAAPRFEEIDHTADWCVRVHGSDFADLLAQAGAAMFAMQGVEMAAKPEIWRTVRVDAPDHEALLVMWLGELLYLSETQRESYTRFVIDDASETTVTGRAGGVPGFGDKAHIKAVTYHDLSVRQDEDGWVAVVLFDT